MMDEILKVLLALIAVLLTRYAIPAINAYLKSKNADELETLISELVTAAEQLIKGSGKGESKLAYVEEMLNAQGIEMTDSVRAKVEAKVYELNSNP